MTTREAFEECNRFLDEAGPCVTSFEIWQAATAAALERAAEVCDDYFADLEPTWDKQQDAASRCAKAIRALKEQQ